MTQWTDSKRAEARQERQQKERTARRDQQIRSLESQITKLKKRNPAGAALLQRHLDARKHSLAQKERREAERKKKRRDASLQLSRHVAPGLHVEAREAADAMVEGAPSAE